MFKGFGQIVPWTAILSIIGWMTLLESRMPKIPKDFPSSNCYKQLEFWKVKPYVVLKINAKKVAFSQGLDHFNSPRVPHNGCKCATK